MAARHYDSICVRGDGCQRPGRSEGWLLVDLNQNAQGVVFHHPFALLVVVRCEFLAHTSSPVAENMAGAFGDRPALLRIRKPANGIDQPEKIAT